MAKIPGLRTSKATDLTSGTLCVVLGLVAFVLSRGRDGFDKGLFQGASIALMLLGVYLLGAAMRTRRETPESDGNNGDDDLWLPSRDQH